MNPSPQLTELARCITARQDSGISNRKGEHSAVLVIVKEIMLDEIKELNGIKAEESNTDKTAGVIILSDEEDNQYIAYIRKLTPKECWRLQGFTDEQFNKVKAIGMSDSQLYKMAGNAVTVPVVFAIGERIKTNILRRCLIVPNWVQINLHFNGEESKIKEMLENFKNDEAGFGSIDFNKIVPMPESLNIECGSKTDEGIKMVKEYLRNVPKEFEEKEGTYDDFFENLKKHGDEILNPDKKEIWDLGVKAARNIVKYDAPTWFEWCVKNWGTKWNACGYDKSPPVFDGESISFKTAWDAPLPIIKKMSEMYHDIKFTIEYADEDLGHNCGRYTFKVGNLTNLFKPKEGREAYDFSAKIWDYDLSDFSLHLNVPQHRVGSQWT